MVWILEWAILNFDASGEYALLNSQCNNMYLSVMRAKSRILCIMYIIP